MSEKIKSFLKRFYHRLGLSGNDKTGLAYWKYRAKKFGKYSVVNLNHSFSEWDEVNNFQKKEIFPVLSKFLVEKDKIILDFGCGPGRFTLDLANLLDGHAVGVDPIPEFLNEAPKGPNVEYFRIEGGRIPLTDASIDVVWICLVLGGLDGMVLSESIREINRVLKKDGLVCLIESTSLKQDNLHWHFRSVEDYQSLFNFTKLEKVHEYMDCGDVISIMIGRY